MNVERDSVLPGKEELVGPFLKKKETRISPEVEGWIQKVEKNVHAKKPVVTDDKGQVILSSAQGKPVKITLPLTKKKFTEGLKQGVDEAVRWLSEWCFRSIKKSPKKISFKEPLAQ